MTTSDVSHPRPDPLVDEVRAIRRALSDEHGNDVGRLAAYLREIERRYAGRVVQPAPSGPTPRAKR